MIRDYTHISEEFTKRLKTFTSKDIDGWIIFDKKRNKLITYPKGRRNG